MNDVAFFISTDMARLGLNINQTARDFRTGSSMVHVSAADAVIPFHIGDGRNRGSSEHHGGVVANFDLQSIIFFYVKEYVGNMFLYHTSFKRISAALFIGKRRK